MGHTSEQAVSGSRAPVSHKYFTQVKRQQVGHTSEQQVLHTSEQATSL